MCFVQCVAFLLAASASSAHGAEGKPTGHSLAVENLLSGRLDWSVSAPLVSPAHPPEDPCHSVKDPSIVFHEGRWHLFCTIRSQKRSHQVEYLSFADWKDADKAPRRVLKISDGYFCGPQVFFFTPHRKWYLILWRLGTLEPTK